METNHKYQRLPPVDKEEDSPVTQKPIEEEVPRVLDILKPSSDSLTLPVKEGPAVERLMRPFRDAIATVFSAVKNKVQTVDRQTSLV